jgi:hypothetical protein
MRLHASWRDLARAAPVTTADTHRQPTLVAPVTTTVLTRIPQLLSLAHGKALVSRGVRKQGFGVATGAFVRPQGFCVATRACRQTAGVQADRRRAGAQGTAHAHCIGITKSQIRRYQHSRIRYQRRYQCSQRREPGRLSRRKATNARATTASSSSALPVPPRHVPPVAALTNARFSRRSSAAATGAHTSSSCPSATSTTPAPQPAGAAASASEMHCSTPCTWRNCG